MNIFENPLTWAVILIGASLCIMAYQEGQVSKEKEHTKQVEMQLKIEMLKVGVTNSPAIRT